MTILRCANCSRVPWPPLECRSRPLVTAKRGCNMRRNTGFLLGASEYLAKPIDSERLAKLIRLYQRDPNGRPVGSRMPTLIVEDGAALRELPHSIVAHILQKGRYGRQLPTTKARGLVPGATSPAGIRDVWPTDKGPGRLPAQRLHVEGTVPSTF